jgi:hypothetical protein
MGSALTLAHCDVGGGRTNQIANNQHDRKATIQLAELVSLRRTYPGKPNPWSRISSDFHHPKSKKMEIIKTMVTMIEGTCSLIEISDHLGVDRSGFPKSGRAVSFKRHVLRRTK